MIWRIIENDTQPNVGQERGDRTLIRSVTSYYASQLHQLLINKFSYPEIPDKLVKTVGVEPTFAGLKGRYTAAMSRLL